MEYHLKIFPHHMMQLCRNHQRHLLEHHNDHIQLKLFWLQVENQLFLQVVNNHKIVLSDPYQVQIY